MGRFIQVRLWLRSIKIKKERATIQLLTSQDKLRYNNNETDTSREEEADVAIRFEAESPFKRNDNKKRNVK